MDDRFKFRAFCQFYNEEQGFVYSDVKKGLFKAFFSDFDAMNAHFLAIEQCTGLSDKNGKLIYENDILQLERKDVCGREEYHYVINAKIERQKNGQYIAIGNGSRYYCWETNLDLVTVIGNIHENPELLEGKK